MEKQLKAFIRLLVSLAGPSITLVYPLYASICAIESLSKEDDEQWLAYWILYSFITLSEMFLYWIPFLNEIKLVFIAWLVLPQFRGASFVYRRYVREQLSKFKEQAASGGAGRSKRERFISFITPKAH